MDELKKKFIEGLTNNQPQLLTKNLIGDVETPISCLLKIKKNCMFICGRWNVGSGHFL